MVKAKDSKTMKPKTDFRIEIDDKGRLVLPPEAVSRYGLKPGSWIRIEDNGSGMRLQSRFSAPAKVYVEPTNRCNLECRTCMRRVWEEPMGEMSRSTFTRIIRGLRAFSRRPQVFFGGIGEPLSHPDIVEMVAQAKGVGASVELITNGTLLNRDMSRKLIDAGLDMLWVSLDGATPESYADVRLGAAFPEVLANIAGFRDARQREYMQRAQIGIVFVAMKRNIADLPKVLKLGKELGARRLLVSNVLPYTSEMREEILYTRTAQDFPYEAYLSLPLLDVNETTRESLYQALRDGQSMSFSWSLWGNAAARCPFIENSTMAINWEGNLSPCLPLMHNYRGFLDRRERFSRGYVVGNVNDATLLHLWNDPAYGAFRERVQNFDFSPCTICGGCEWGEGNEQDCFGNSFPTCGGCLWAMGVVQCP